MLLDSDDETAEVADEFLGPRAFTLPWRARFIAYGIGGVVFFGLEVGELALGAPLHFWWLVFTLLGAVAVTRAICRGISYEMPFRARIAVMWHELNAPRRPTKRVEARLRPGQVHTFEACGRRSRRGRPHLHRVGINDALRSNWRDQAASPSEEAA